MSRQSPASTILEKPSSPEQAATLTVLGVVNEPVRFRPQAPTLLMPIEASVARVTVGNVEQNIDRSLLVVLPIGEQVVVEAVSAALRIGLMTLFPPLFHRVEGLYRSLGYQQAHIDEWLRMPAVLPRTVWIHEIVHRYIFERYALGIVDNEATSFLEAEILKELYFLFRDGDKGEERASMQYQYCDTVQAALAYLESHLFDSPSIAALTKHAGASESTLLRAFRRDLGITPVAYWRGRKLEVALDLLRTGRPTVAEVAAQVGYEDTTAFGNAFRSRFGRAPSHFRPKKHHRSPP